MLVQRNLYFFQKEINHGKDNQKLIRKAVNKGCVGGRVETMDIQEKLD